MLCKIAYQEQNKFYLSSLLLLEQLPSAVDSGVVSLLALTSNFRGKWTAALTSPKLTHRRLKYPQQVRDDLLPSGGIKVSLGPVHEQGGRLIDWLVQQWRSLTNSLLTGSGQNQDMWDSPMWIWHYRNTILRDPHWSLLSLFRVIYRSLPLICSLALVLCRAYTLQNIVYML